MELSQERGEIEKTCFEGREVAAGQFSKRSPDRISRARRKILFSDREIFLLTQMKMLADDSFLKV